jgi:sulfur carrier protein ThiS|tara:strand:+ start:105 stop:305 length:201 start_codon:yes stop_codon:yes gene_type:complete
MQVTIVHEGDSKLLDCEEGLTIREILTKIEIHPSTVLAVHDGVIVPHDSQVTGDISIELITVSSGG